MLYCDTSRIMLLCAYTHYIEYVQLWESNAIVLHFVYPIMLLDLFSRWYPICKKYSVYFINIALYIYAVYGQELSIMFHYKYITTTVKQLYLFYST